MPVEYDIRSVVIADDLRKEDNGKDILIGVYSGTVKLSSVPIIMPSFAIRLEVLLRQKKISKADLVILKPDKGTLIQFSGQPEFDRTDYPVALAFKASPIVFDQVGEYEIRFGIEDKRPRRVSNFWVITD